MDVALAHDYITQRGGAERVVLSLARAFPHSPLYTTLFEPTTTYPEFRSIDVRTTNLNGSALLRRYHRLAMPLLRSTVSKMVIDADVAVISSSGWAHGAQVTGRKIVYCHAPARWLYQTEKYAGARGGRRTMVNAAVATLGRGLRSWDQRAAASADLYIANSTAIRNAIRDTYGIEAELVHPPATLLPVDGDTRDGEIPNISEPFVLCVARLLPYKNVDVVIDAVLEVAGLNLVVVGTGPERDALASRAKGSARVQLAGTVTDTQLRWLYENCIGLVAASHEDFGLSPIEAASFGKPVAALRAGGYLDTVVDGQTGVFFDSTDLHAVASAVDALVRGTWSRDRIRSHADTFSETRFIERMQQLVGDERDTRTATTFPARSAD